MKYADDSVAERQSKQHALKRFIIKVGQSSSNYAHQQLLSALAFPDYEIPHKPVMPSLVISLVSALIAKLKRRAEYLIKIRIYEHTFINSHYRHKLPALMHAERHIAVLHLIAERIFHFIPVSRYLRTAFYPQILAVSYTLVIQQIKYRLSLELHLFLILDTLVKTSAAHILMLANFHI